MPMILCVSILSDLIKNINASLSIYSVMQSKHMVSAERLHGNESVRLVLLAPVKSPDGVCVAEFHRQVWLVAMVGMVRTL